MATGIKHEKDGTLLCKHIIRYNSRESWYSLYCSLKLLDKQKNCKIHSQEQMKKLKQGNIVLLIHASKSCNMCITF